MLAFDIETEDLDNRYNQITVASIYDPERGISRTFNFLKDPERFQSERDEFIKALDEADALCCFNGVRFDIPFIAQRFRIHKEQQGRWVLKTFDFFEVCKLCFGSSCSLNSLLLANGYEVKISHGRQAVIWAREKNWKSLEEYCMKDAVLTYQISMSPHVRTPLSRWPGSVRVACIREPPMHGSGTNNGIGTSAQLRHASEALPHAAQEGAADDPSCMSHQGCKRKRPAALSLAVTTATPVECPGKPIPVACPLPEKLNQLGCGTAPREPWPCIHLEAAVAPGHGASV